MINNLVIELIRNCGIIINPILLKLYKEKNQLLVFYFHGLYETQKQKDLNHIDPQNNLTVAEFIRFVEYFLQKEYVFIKPEDLCGDLKKDKAYAMLTFDDGYYNNIHAIDILKKYSIPVTFFIATKFLIENKSFWWDIVYKYRAKESISLEKIRKEQNYLKSFKNNYIDKYIRETFGTKSFIPWSDIDRPFNEEELRCISNNTYVSIGNHSHSHAILTDYERDEIRNEYEVSNNILFDLTKTRPFFNSFPNGNYNETVLEVTKEIGFRFSFTTEFGINNLPIIINNYNCLKRYLVDINRNSNCNFYRLGYNPRIVVSKIKQKLKSI